MINLAKRIKYAHEDPRDMSATREHRTRTARCVWQAQIQPASIMGVILQESGAHEAIRQQAGKDTRPHPEGGGQEDQRSQIWWTTARLLKKIRKS